MRPLARNMEIIMEVGALFMLAVGGREIEDDKKSHFQIM